MILIQFKLMTYVAHESSGLPKDLTGGNCCTTMHCSSKKREQSLDILRSFFVGHLSEYETSDSDRMVNRIWLYFSVHLSVVIRRFIL